MLSSADLRLFIYLIHQLNFYLMKKSLFQFKMRKMAVLPVIALFAFMLMGSVSVSAQYLGKTESIKELGSQLRALQTEIQQVATPTLEQKSTLSLKRAYAQTVRNSILEGVDVATALNTSKRKVRMSQRSATLELSAEAINTIFSEVEDVLLQE
jgi:hypothetical protein